MLTLKERLLEGNWEIKFMHQIFIDLHTIGQVPISTGTYAINMQGEITSKSGRCCEEKQNRVRVVDVVNKEKAFEL